jgi:hypothetical protein
MPEVREEAQLAVTLTEEIELGLIFLLLGYPVSALMSRTWGLIIGRKGFGVAFPISEKEKREREADSALRLLSLIFVLVCGGILVGVLAAIFWIVNPGANVVGFVWAGVAMEYSGLVLIRVIRPRMARVGGVVSDRVSERLRAALDQPQPGIPEGVMGRDEEGGGPSNDERP